MIGTIAGQEDVGIAGGLDGRGEHPRQPLAYRRALALVISAFKVGFRRRGFLSPPFAACIIGPLSLMPRQGNSYTRNDRPCINQLF